MWQRYGWACWVHSLSGSFQFIRFTVVLWPPVPAGSLSSGGAAFWEQSRVSAGTLGRELCPGAFLRPLSHLGPPPRPVPGSFADTLVSVSLPTARRRPPAPRPAAGPRVGSRQDSGREAACGDWLRNGLSVPVPSGDPDCGVGAPLTTGARVEPGAGDGNQTRTQRRWAQRALWPRDCPEGLPAEEGVGPGPGRGQACPTGQLPGAECPGPPDLVARRVHVSPSRPCRLQVQGRGAADSGSGEAPAGPTGRACAEPMPRFRCCR